MSSHVMTTLKRAHPSRSEPRVSPEEMVRSQGTSCELNTLPTMPGMESLLLQSSSKDDCASYGKVTESTRAAVGSCSLLCFSFGCCAGK